MHMKKISASKIEYTVRKLCVRANTLLRPDILRALKKARRVETHKTSKRILGILLENARIAKKEKRAICQDTGFVSVYVELGQDVRITGGGLTEAVNRGVMRAYKDAFLRKSVVKSPLLRENTATNTPSMIHTEIVKGDKLNITVLPKGVGSENKSALKMLKPTEGEKEIISFVLEVVGEAGPDACPPYILGIGLGGMFDKAPFLAKKALTLSISRPNPKRHLRKLENAILKGVNKLGIGPMGFGATTTCLGVRILEYPTHIGGLPVAVNIGCHATRSAGKSI